jgi:hypothetical protein
MITARPSSSIDDLMHAALTEIFGASQAAKFLTEVLQTTDSNLASVAYLAIELAYAYTSDLAGAASVNPNTILNTIFYATEIDYFIDIYDGGIDTDVEEVDDVTSFYGFQLPSLPAPTSVFVTYCDIETTIAVSVYVIITSNALEGIYTATATDYSYLEACGAATTTYPPPITTTFDALETPFYCYSSTNAPVEVDLIISTDSQGSVHTHTSTIYAELLSLCSGDPLPVATTVTTFVSAPPDCPVRTVSYDGEVDFILTTDSAGSTYTETVTVLSSLTYCERSSYTIPPVVTNTFDPLTCEGTLTVDLQVETGIVHETETIYAIGTVDTMITIPAATNTYCATTTTGTVCLSARKRDCNQQFTTIITSKTQVVFFTNPETSVPTYAASASVNAHVAGDTVRQTVSDSALSQSDQVPVYGDSTTPNPPSSETTSVAVVISNSPTKSTTDAAPGGGSAVVLPSSTAAPDPPSSTSAQDPPDPFSDIASKGVVIKSIVPVSETVVFGGQTWTMTAPTTIVIGDSTLEYAPSVYSVVELVPDKTTTTVDGSVLVLSGPTTAVVGGRSVTWAGNSVETTTLDGSVLVLSDATTVVVGGQSITWEGNLVETTTFDGSVLLLSDATTVVVGGQSITYAGSSTETTVVDGRTLTLSAPTTVVVSGSTLVYTGQSSVLVTLVTTLSMSTVSSSGVVEIVTAGGSSSAPKATTTSHSGAASSETMSWKLWLGIGVSILLIMKGI